MIRLKNGQVLHLDVRDDIRENDEEQIRYIDFMTSSSLFFFFVFSFSDLFQDMKIEQLIPGEHYPYHDCG